MPLPASSITINGGCNCRAIRYRIAIPSLPQRPIHPYSHGKAPLPTIVTDHCNDCRRATGSILPAWICTPLAFVSASALPRSALSDPGAPSHAASPEPNDAIEASREWVPALDVFEPARPTESFVSCFRSSPGVTRTFCGRCGTHLTYMREPTPPGWPDMLDVVLGSVDRDELAAEWLTPERHLWWDCGLDWVRELVSAGERGLERHPAYRLDEAVG
ncbi:hypothetical protein MMC17_006874 [Xylographa soralifera]|nr:hypothetical protein [Xylographa soralifera]MCJ1383760.1 hypothetical protein [Xylographa soralifera]